MLRLLLFLLIGLSIQSCQVKGTPKSVDRDPGKEDMFRSFNKHRSLVIIYGSQEASSSEQYLAFAEKIKERLSGGRRPLKVIIERDDTYQPETWKELPSLLIGTPASNLLLARICPHLPFKQAAKEFTWEGKTFDKENQAYQLSFFPNPDSIWTPVNVVSGNSEQAVLSVLEGMTGGRRFSLWRSLPFQIYEGKKRIALGDFDKNWQTDKELSWYFDPNPPTVFEEEGVSVVEHMVEMPEERFTDEGRAVLKAFEKIKEFSNSSESLPKASVYLYGRPEVIGMMKNEMQTSVLEEESIHKLVHPYFPAGSPEAENIWAIKKLLGEAASPILENGLGIYFAENWQIKGYAYWSAKLYRSGDWQSIDELLHPEFGDYESPLIKGALSASFVDFLLKEWGRESFLEKYTSWNPSNGEIKKLNKKWINFLKEEAELNPPENRIVELPAYLKGMTFAHEGYSVYNGFGSTLAKNSLKEIRNHHVNMVSIVPYSGTRETKKPMPYRLSRGAGGENDVSVVFASKAAQELGMKTMMKPQIYFGGSWPGDLDMRSKEDWEMFFKHYRRWISHYALLAEIHGFDMMCLGTEFVKATGKQPDAWKKLALDMRKIFSGKITYAANWGEEIENISLDFAAELDFLGVDCYYPLSDKDDVDDEDLEAGFSKTMKKLGKISKKTGKSIVFTEVGFRSIPKPWKQPHAEAPDDQAAEEDQARCYRVVLEAMRNQDWQIGMIWWKWPSYMNYGSRSPQSFTPAGKEAANVLKEYYGNEDIWE